ncbi:hypothetical protein BD770DRAFT_439789 [Pilaira anomala]|nr:hypothetical protein BD770DRAFT_439789 [Pilaira anomala]
MKWSEYNRNIYGVTPPKEPDEEEKLQPTHHSALPLDPETLHSTLTLLRARLQYARLKIITGLSTEELQQIEHSFLSTPRQPRAPLPEEYPPVSSHQATQYARKIKRALLSGKSAQKTGKKKQASSKKKVEQVEQEPIVEEQDAEAAARTILMLSKEKLTPTPSSSNSSSSSSSNSSNSSESEIKRKAELLRSPDINHIRYTLPPSYHYRPQKSLYDVVAKIPNYEEKSREAGKSLPRRKKKEKIPPAVISHQNEDTGSPHQYYQYNRPLPAHQYPPSSTYEHSLPEDPFYSRPIVPNNLSISRYQPPPSPPLTK